MTPEEDLRQGADLVGRLAAAGRISDQEAEQLHQAMDSALDAGRARFGAVLCWIAAALAAVMCCGPMLWTWQLPAFKKMFEEMQLKEGLPYCTELLLAVPWWLQAMLLAGLAAAMIVKEFVIRSRAIAVAISVAAIVLLFLYGAFVKWALFAPMVEMMRQLTGQGG